MMIRIEIMDKRSSLFFSEILSNHFQTRHLRRQLSQCHSPTLSPHAHKLHHHHTHKKTNTHKFMKLVVQLALRGVFYEDVQIQIILMKKEKRPIYVREFLSCGVQLEWTGSAAMDLKPECLHNQTFSLCFFGLNENSILLWFGLNFKVVELGSTKEVREEGTPVRTV